jgi:hypothetical protein
MAKPQSTRRKAESLYPLPVSTPVGCLAEARAALEARQRFLGLACQELSRGDVTNARNAL